MNLAHCVITVVPIYLNLESHPIWVPKMAKGSGQVTFNTIKVKTIKRSGALANARATEILNCY